MTDIDIPIPSLAGHRAVLTGGSDGMGLVIAERLAAAGAEVVLPVRNRGKGDRAVRTIRERVPDARVELHDLDRRRSRASRRSPTRSAPTGGRCTCSSTTPGS